MACRTDCKQKSALALRRRTAPAPALGMLPGRGGCGHLSRIRELCEPHLTWGDTLWAGEIERDPTMPATDW